jgi:hypothetical protein
MATAKSAPGRARRAWFWRFRKDESPAIVEQLDDGRWRITINNREIATVASRDVAVTLIDELDRAKARAICRQTAPDGRRHKARQSSETTP